MEAQKPLEGSPKLSLDTLAEDLFGLSIRGLQTILTAWGRPRKYFDAARTTDWNGTYTPSIRLWLSFFALFSALKFWWFGSNAGMIGAFAAGFQHAGLNLPEGVTYWDVGSEAVLWVFGWVPVIQIACMILLGLVYNVWAERTTLALRQRYLFAVMIPSSSLMPVFLTVMLAVPMQLMTAYGMFLAVAAFVIDFQTGYRGAFSSASRLGRAWRAGLLALILVTINTCAAVGVQIAGIILISQKYTAAAGF